MKSKFSSLLIAGTLFFLSTTAVSAGNYQQNYSNSFRSSSWFDFDRVNWSILEDCEDAWYWLTNLGWQSSDKHNSDDKWSDNKDSYDHDRSYGDYDKSYSHKSYSWSDNDDDHDYDRYSKDSKNDDYDNSYSHKSSSWSDDDYDRYSKYSMKHDNDDWYSHDSYDWSDDSNSWSNNYDR